MTEKSGLSAEYFRRRYQWLHNFDDAQVQEISLCSQAGEELEEGEDYFDLNHPERGPFRAEESGKIPKGACYVSRKKVSRESWDKLTKPRLH